MGYKKYDRAINSFFRGLKSTARTANKISRAVDKANRQHSKEVAQRYKQQQKALALVNAQQEVQTYEEYIYLLKSVHKNCSDDIDWNEVKSSSAPFKPELLNTYEQEAIRELNDYKSNIFEKLFKLENNKTQKLKQNILVGKEKDTNLYKHLCEKHETAFAEWEGAQAFSEAILGKEIEAYKRVFEEFDSFSDLNNFGSKLDVKLSANYVIVDYYVNDKEVIPSEEKKLTVTGKLSIKPIPKSQFNEIYQDYVCSCVLRVAREVFAVIPIKTIVVNAIGSIVDSRTGNLEDLPIVSALIKRKNLNSLNLQTLDPSDSMQNFITNMKFSKTNGFQPVEKIIIKDFETE